MNEFQHEFDKDALKITKLDDYCSHYLFVKSILLKPQFKASSREFLEKRFQFTKREALSAINNMGHEDGSLAEDDPDGDTIYQWFTSAPDDILPP